jgi:hypothetical protein
MKVKINITQELIDEGIACSNILCPLALAFGKVIEDGFRFVVTAHHLIIQDNPFKFPIEAYDFRKISIMV